MKSLFLKASFVWFGLCVLAFANGALREIVFKQNLRVVEPLANQFSCLTGVLFLTVFLILCWPYLNIKSFAQASGVGFVWFFATLLFETFLIDRNLDWVQIVQTYDFSAGQYWGLVLIWIGIMPVVFFMFVPAKLQTI